MSKTFTILKHLSILFALATVLGTSPLAGQDCSDYLRFRSLVNYRGWEWDEQSTSGYFRYGVTSSTTLEMYEGYLYKIFFSATSALNKNFTIKVYDEQNNLLNQVEAKKALSPNENGGMYFMEYVAESNRRIRIEISVPDKLVSKSVVSKFDNYGGMYQDTVYTEKPFYGEGCIGLVVYSRPIAKKGFY